ncbi:MAG: hypothetical protein GX616_15335 [Planctomycetes bacterium]|nr:hypothetical protein [Planctomycetota bacterium]
MLAEDTEICESCGALLHEGVMGYLGRPLFVLAGRWLAVAVWVCQAMAAMTGLVDASLPSVAILWFWVVIPIALLILVISMRIPHRSLGVLAVTNIMIVILSSTVLSTTAGSVSGVDWSVIAITAVPLLAMLPFVYQFWDHPLPRASLLSCQNCGYLLRGLTVARCPECGARFDPRRLKRVPGDQKRFSTPAAKDD